MVSISKGQRVHIIAGAYKRNGFGTYLGTYGKAMCKVKIDGDNRPERHIWRTSITPILEENCADNSPPEKPKTSSGASSGGEEEMISISKLELQTMAKEISGLKATVAQLESKLNALLID